MRRPVSTPAVMRVPRALYPGKCFALPGGPKSLLVVPGRRARRGDPCGRPPEWLHVEGGDKPRPYSRAGAAAGGGVGSTEPPKSAGAGFAGAEAGRGRA